MLSKDSSERYMFMKAVRKDYEDEVLGFAIWYKPGMEYELIDKSKMDKEEKEAFSDVSEENQNQIYEAFKKVRREIQGDEATKSWYVSIIPHLYTILYGQFKSC